MIAADEVFITVVAVRPLDVRATVDEKDLTRSAEPSELKGLVTPTVDPEHRLPVRLDECPAGPREPGKFDVLADVELGPEAALIKPGMACSVKLVPYRNADALTVPATAVFEDDGRRWAITHVVYLARQGRQAPEATSQDRQVCRWQDRDRRRPCRRG